MVPFLAGATGLASTIWNGASQSNMNRKTRNYNTQMYQTQRKDALNDWIMQNAYNEKMWGKQNEYNEGLWNKQNQYNQEMWQKMNDYDSPAAQMARYKAAGLNPHLIYGQSNTGGSISSAPFTSDNQKSSDVRGTNAQGWSPRAPQYDFQNGILSMANVEEQNARTNNLEATNKVLEQDAVLRSVQIANNVTKNAHDKLSLNMASDLYQTSVDAARANLRQTQIQTDLALRADERAAVMQKSNLNEAAHRIATMRGQQINQAMDAQLKQLDINLKSIGIQPGDAMWMRVLGQIFNEPLNQGTKKLNWIMKTD